jgi:uncharacterized protein YndB with AHSA1/START domain
MPQMKKHEGATIALPSEREIVITRLFDAPPARVFEAWTTPEQVARWWDPARVPLAACEIDLRPGGAFRFVHAGPGGPGHAFAGVYREIDPPSRLVFATPSPSGATSIGTLLFGARGKTTLLTMTIACSSKADRDALLSMRVDVGTARTLDNLDEYLATGQRES